MIFAASAAPAQQLDRPATILGHPNFNGIWQALNTAYWNLEAHPVESLSKDFWQLGAIGVIPAGQSVLHRGGTIPYLPEALKKRDENRAHWPAADPEAKCYMLGVPRVTYQNFPFQIFQAEGDLLMVYPFAATNRIIYMKDHSDLPVIPGWGSPAEPGKATFWWSPPPRKTASRGSIAPETSPATS